MQNKLIICAGCSFALALSSGLLYAQTTNALSSEQIKQLLDEQTRKLTEERKKLAAQEAQLSETRRNLDEAQRQLNDLRKQAGLAPPAPAAPPPTATPAAAAPQVAQQAQNKPVGQAPDDNRPLEVAQIFQQPGVLTPRGEFTFEPSLQYGYSTSNRLALVGYTVIPAILIGLIDVREVKRSTYTTTLTGRYGITNRFELEARVPYVYRDDSSVGREILEGSARNTVFDSDGKGLGDVEFTARYQFNDGGADTPFYVGTMRVKTRTGTDPFESEISTRIAGFRSGIETELPTGSGFYGVQPGLTVLYPSDPAVFFGSISYLYSFERDNLKQETDTGDVEIGSVQPGGILEFNFGMGLALNDRSSFSIGYDQSSVGKIEQNGHSVEDSVTVQLATLLLGFSYQLNPYRALNLSVGAGLTADTPDVTLTLRMPMNF
jgi:ribosomal protein L12E/L44/L45/RPP1/RPP2